MIEKEDNSIFIFWRMTITLTLCDSIWPNAVVPKILNIYWPYLWHYADDKTFVTRKKFDKSLKRTGANFYSFKFFIFSLTNFFSSNWNTPKNKYHSFHKFFVLSKITFIIKIVQPYAISLWAKQSWVDSVWLCKTFIISPHKLTATFYYHITSVRLLVI